jgi:hypothetical protein
LLTNVAAIAGLVERNGEEEIDLSNGITIEIQTASFRSVRGFTIIACLCDEIAFWRSDESANPDTEILAAIRPAMSTIPGACCCAPAALTPSAEAFGIRTAVTTASRVRCWCGKPIPAR